MVVEVPVGRSGFDVSKGGRIPPRPISCRMRVPATHTKLMGRTGTTRRIRRAHTERRLGTGRREPNELEFE